MVGKMQSLFPSISVFDMFNAKTHFTSKSPHGRKDTSLFPSTRSLIFSAQKCLKSKRPHGQAVKTSPSHGGIWGSIPHGGTKKTSPLGLVFFIRCLQRHVINACVVCNFNRCVSPMSHCTLRVRNSVARTPEH